MSGDIVTFAGCVNAWECDQMGHLNVQFYQDKATQALGQLRGLLGLSSRDLRRCHRAVMPRGERILFEREVHAGQILEMRSCLRRVDRESLVFSSQLWNMEAGEIAARFETEAHCLNADDGTPVAWPLPVIDAAGVRIGQGNDHAPPRPIIGPRANPEPAVDLPVTLRTTVNSWQVNEVGLAPPQIHIGCYSDCIIHCFDRVGMDRAWLVDNQIGMAALDYDLTYGTPLRLATPLEVRSQFLELREKVFRMVHYLVNAETGAVASRVEVAGVTFDLRNRKSLPLPEFVRARAYRLAMG